MKSNLLLLLTAVIWGFAFVAQRSGMEYIGPFTFNTARFALGSISLIPLLVINKKKNHKEKILPINDKTFLYGGLSAGTVTFSRCNFSTRWISFYECGQSWIHHRVLRNSCSDIRIIYQTKNFCINLVWCYRSYHWFIFFKCE